MFKVNLIVALLTIMILPFIINAEETKQSFSTDTYKMDQEELKIELSNIQAKYINFRTFTYVGIGGMILGSGLTYHANVVLKNTDFGEGNSYGIFFLLEGIGGIAYFTAGLITTLIFAPEMVRYKKQINMLKIDLIQYESLSEFHSPGFGIEFKLSI